MPAYSPGYLNLVDRFAVITQKFIADQVENEMINISTFDPDIERLAAFRLLVHAEIEEYIEKKAKIWVAEKEIEIKAGTYTVENLLKIYPIAMRLNKKLPFESPFDKSKYTESLLNVIKCAIDAIDENNGIKGDSFVNLSLLCGKNVDEIDDAVSILLTSYGKGRGDVAHKSTTSVRTIQAPSVELNNAHALIKALGKYFYP